MPNKFNLKRAVALAGLYFAPGRPFSSMAAAERFTACCRGPTSPAAARSNNTTPPTTPTAGSSSSSPPSLLPPLPTKHTPTSALRLLLLTTTTAPTPRAQYPPALFPAPIAFLTSHERREWTEPSARQARQFAHLDEFLSFAGEILFRGSGGHDRDDDGDIEMDTGTGMGTREVAGLLTPWFATVQEARDGAGLRRLGVALMVRTVPERGAVQVVVFCPWDGEGSVREAWRAQEWRVRLWKEKLVGVVRDWVEGKGVAVLEWYSGGSVAVAGEMGGVDSVGICVGWLGQVVTAVGTAVPRGGEGGDWA
ncbi:hypothetical protein C8A05DRAFT_31029 [Staphylotrichum tortipilum]|uniref:Uncharacterized protein n=1 Tax=Staphylotrichum tortipilum TaxID=2831512 RepID=A0AAN6MRL6_9PEZI|nr:hypothetical protein C8A05DRAFT_31029 [Staphylotrichum longicolle]